MRLSFRTLFVPNFPMCPELPRSTVSLHWTCCRCVSGFRWPRCTRSRVTAALQLDGRGPWLYWCSRRRWRTASQHALIWTWPRPLCRPLPRKTSEWLVRTFLSNVKSRLTRERFRSQTPIDIILWNFVDHHYESFFGQTDCAPIFPLQTII